MNIFCCTLVSVFVGQYVYCKNICLGNIKCEMHL